MLLVATLAASLLSLGISAAARWGIWTCDRFTLLLWWVLVANRALIPRVESVEASHLAWDAPTIAEVAVTCAVFVSSVLLFLWRVRSLRLKAIPASLKLLALYATAAGGSLLYSPSPSYSAFWFLRLLSIVILLAVYFASGGDPLRLSRVTAIAAIPYIVLPWLALLQNRASEGGRVGGYWLHPILVSAIGYAIAVGYLLTWLQKTRKASALILGVFGLTAAYMAGGKAPAVAMALVLLMVLAANRRVALSARGIAAAVVAALVVMLVAYHADVGLVSHWRVYEESDFGTLRDRILLWQSSIPMWLNFPVLGQGFASTKITQLSTPGREWTALHMHNSFLQPLIEVGLLGAIPLCLGVGIVVARTLRLGGRTFRDRSVGPIASAWYVLLLCGLTDLIFGGSPQPQTCIFYGLLVSLDALTRSQTAAYRSWKKPWRPC
jgi:O-antigen ligase